MRLAASHRKNGEGVARRGKRTLGRLPPTADGEGFDSFAATIFPDNELGILAENSGTESGTLQDETGTVAPDLAAVIAALKSLTSEQLRQIVAILGEGSLADV